MVYDDHIKRRQAFRVAIGVTMLVLMLAGNANAENLTVCPSGCVFSSIQTAINASSNGDTIQVQSGTYYENVNVNKQLTLRGIGVPVVDAMGSGSAITLSADGITLEGFSATGTFSYYEAGIKVNSNNNRLINNNAYYNGGFDTNFGIRLDSSSNNELIGNNVSNNNVGIELYFSNNNRLTGNNASNNYADANGGGGLGISLSSSNNNTLSGNIMINNEDNFGVTGSIDSHYNNSIDISNTVNGKPIYYFQSVSDKVYTTYANVGTFYCIKCNNITVRDSIFSNNLNGVFFWKTNDSKIENIDTSGNYYGIHLSSSSNNRLIGNEASNNGYNGAYGIYLDSSSNNYLIGNNASNNIRYHSGTCPGGIGIYLGSSSNNTLSGNTASNNGDGCGGFGIFLSSSSNNKMFHNNIIENNDYDSDANDDSSPNSWDNGYPSGGNYWSDYTGVDLNSSTSQNIPGSDGIGDIPYNIGGGALAQDRYPLMSPLTPGSPVESITGQGTVYFDTATGTVQDLTAVNPDDIPETPPSEVNLNYGLFRFNITDIIPGGSATLTLTFPEILPAGTTYWKYGANTTNSTPHWYTIPSTINGNTITITLIDGGDGDDDLIENGRIRDDGGPSIPQTTYIVPLTSGWNLISAPLNLTTWILGNESAVGNPLNVTPTNCISSIYRYNTNSDLFEKSDHFTDWGWWPATGSGSFTKLEPGRGYWVMAQQDCSLTFTGTEPSDLDIPLETGWNLIGWYSMNEAPLGEEAIVGNPLNVTPTNTLTSIYRYNTTSGSFEKSDHFDDWGWYHATGSEGFTELAPGRGYWVMAQNEAGWRQI